MKRRDTEQNCVFERLCTVTTWRLTKTASLLLLRFFFTLLDKLLDVDVDIQTAGLYRVDFMAKIQIFINIWLKIQQVCRTGS